MCQQANGDTKIMNVAVRPEALGMTPRYIGYDLLARAHLRAGPDDTLVAKCHAAMLAEVSYREGGREYDLAETSGVEARCSEIEANQQWRRAWLGRLVTEAAQLPAQTDIGLMWKGDTLIHLVESFDPEAMPQIVSFATHYAREVSGRFASELAQGAAGGSNALPGMVDGDILAALQQVRECLDRREAVTVALRAASLSTLKRHEGAVEEVETALDDQERAVHASLERARLFCPMAPDAIIGLAELVTVLLRERTGRHQQAAVCELSRNLANAVRTYVGAREISQDHAIAS